MAKKGKTVYTLLYDWELNMTADYGIKGLMNSETVSAHRLSRGNYRDRQQHTRIQTMTSQEYPRKENA